MKHFFTFLLLCTILFSCSKEEIKEEIPVEEISNSIEFSTAVIGQVNDATTTIKNVAEFAVQYFLSSAITGTGAIYRASCENIDITGNTITTCYDGSCEVNGTTYTGCFVCVFDDITDPNSDIDITFDDAYSINGKDVDGVLNLDFEGNVMDCKVYNIDSLNIDTRDGAFEYNFFEHSSPLSNFTYCNNNDLISSNDIIIFNPNSKVTNRRTGDFCNTQTVQDLKIDFTCQNLYPTSGRVDILQTPQGSHIPINTGYLDYNYLNPCDSLVAHYDVFLDTLIVINLSE